MELTSRTKRIILEIGRLSERKLEMTGTLIAKNTDTTYPFTHRVIARLAENDIIRYCHSKNNRIRPFELTGKGLNVYTHLHKLKELGLE